MNGSNQPLERRNSALSSGSEVGGVNPVLSQKLSKVFVLVVCSKASMISMSTAEEEDVWHSVQMINEANIVAMRST